MGAPADRSDQFVEMLCALPSRSKRLAVVRSKPELWNTAFVERLYDAVVRLVRVDLIQAERLAQLSAWMAGEISDPYARAQACRSLGHVLYARSQHAKALEQYEAALVILTRLKRDLDVARTLNGAIHCASYLGKYQTALLWAGRARRVFERYGDQLRLARLDVNIGNVLYRQDRFQEALECYQGARETLLTIGQPEDVAALYSNLAVCHISLSHFDEALVAYEQARAHCLAHNMSLLVAEADYNIAYLHYLRGEYTNAIALYDLARLNAADFGDRYHMALCDLDEAEMYLELNLVERAGDLANKALDQFRDLGMKYETAKALANAGLVAARHADAAKALDLFEQARRLFRLEHNRVWPALLDLYSGLVLFEAGNLKDARRLCSSALRFFSRLRLPAKAAVCEIILAKIEHRQKRFPRARAACRSALRRLATAEAPAISFHAHVTHGDIEEALGNRAAATRAFQKAHARLEDLRSNLTGEELKISILKDKLGVYESLVWLTVEGRGHGRERARRAFAYIEQAKSRTLADLIAFQLSTLPVPKDNRLGEELRTRRKEMHACYRRLEALNARGQIHTRETTALRSRAAENQKEIEGIIQQLRESHTEFASVQENGIISVEQAQLAIPGDASVLEYYETRGRLYACVITSGGLEVVPLGDAAEAGEVARLLQFQLAKFRLGPKYFEQNQALLRRTTDEHLAALYRLLVEPLRRYMQGRRLVVVPHGFLHQVPFHALMDGDGYLIDKYSFSYAPSVSVFQLSQAKHSRPGERSLILGVPDGYAPQIAGEIKAVAASLPRATTFTGPNATVERLREYAPSSRYIHIATHGWFRQDNPMFSSIRLGTSEVRVFEFYELSLTCDLITLSGCGTGLSTVVAGDELLGLVRGLLYAGARTVLVSLWDVSDASTARFMELFYRELAGGGDKSAALRAAMTRLRSDYPHPFFWAPFVLIGSNN